jgi:hypothetical protein
MVTIERPNEHSHYILTKNGYYFMYQMAWFGECLYLHRSIPKFEMLRAGYEQHTIPQWDLELKSYLIERDISNITKHE